MHTRLDELFPFYQGDISLLFDNEPWLSRLDNVRFWADNPHYAFHGKGIPITYYVRDLVLKEHYQELEDLQLENHA